MRHIVQQATLPLHGRLQAGSHPVEVTAEIGELIVAGADLSRDPALEIAAGGSFECSPQAAYRSRYIPCEE